MPGVLPVVAQQYAKYTNSHTTEIAATTTLPERLQWTECPITMLMLKSTAASARVNRKEPITRSRANAASLDTAPQ